MIEVESSLKERFLLAKERIAEIPEEHLIKGGYEEYFVFKSLFFLKISEVMELMLEGKLASQTKETLEAYCEFFYDPLRNENYEVNYGNPVYAQKLFGKEVGPYLCFFHAYMRDSISYVYQYRPEPVIRRMELFLQVYLDMAEGVKEGQSEKEMAKSLKTILYYEMHDYSDLVMEESLDELLNPKLNFASNIIMNSDFNDRKYLYLYGLNVTENEYKTAEYLSRCPEEELESMARTFTEGYRQGFIAAGIDLSRKTNVEIRYHLGFEPMVRQVILQFEEMGLNPIIQCRSNIQSFGVETTPANRQYLYDHRFDESLYLNHAIAKKKLQEMEQGLEARKELARAYAGPAVIETFGEAFFSPVTKPERAVFNEEQEKIDVAYRRDSMLIRNRYIPQEEYSYAIISYPIPDIGDQFEEIFHRTVEVNTLDPKQYCEIQEKLISALDQGEYVTVTGRDGNHTNMKIMLHELKDNMKETNFENCLADVNIPVGEVFTSPMLTGTEGILHVKNVYLNEFEYKNLTLHFTDGMITDYTCSNYEAEEENKKFIKQNLLKNRETLPIGEFAIGTNTTAYQMGKDFGIERKLPILIAEKTGPHFAVGDTCYSMSEDIAVKNPDGKVVIARDNECSALRSTEIEKAYFNCHTDITISYHELGDIIVHTKEGEMIPLILEGRFVFPGTEILNEAMH